MPESTRVAKLSTVEVHLKSTLEASQSKLEGVLPTYPPSAPWHLMLYNPNADMWTHLNTFDTFIAADEAFISEASGRGASNAQRLTLDPKEKGQGRVIGPEA